MSDNNNSDQIADHRKWCRHALMDARNALWDGKCGKAFKSIEDAEEQFKQLDKLLEEELDNE